MDEWMVRMGWGEGRWEGDATRRGEGRDVTGGRDGGRVRREEERLGRT